MRSIQTARKSTGGRAPNKILKPLVFRAKTSAKNRAQKMLLYFTAKLKEWQEKGMDESLVGNKQKKNHNEKMVTLYATKCEEWQKKCDSL